MGMGKGKKEKERRGKVEIWLLPTAAGMPASAAAELRVRRPCRRPARSREGGRAVNDVVSCLPERRATSISRRRRLFARSFVVAVAMITYRGGRATAASGRGDNDGVKKLLSDACSANAVRPYIFLRGIFLYMTTDGSFGVER